MQAKCRNNSDNAFYSFPRTGFSRDLTFCPEGQKTIAASKILRLKKADIKSFIRKQFKQAFSSFKHAFQTFKQAFPIASFSSVKFSFKSLFPSSLLSSSLLSSSLISANLTLLLFSQTLEAKEVQKAPDKVRFQLDWLPGGDKTAIYVCVNRGFCKSEGLDVAIEPGRGGNDAITRIAAGVSDVGAADITALMAARVSANVKVSAVMAIFNKTPHAFYVLSDSPIHSIADIKGKAVATSPFTASNLFLPPFLKTQNLSMDDIALTRVDSGALGPMLITGKTDVIIAWLTDYTRYEEQARIAHKEIRSFPWVESGLDLYGSSLIAADKFISERPEVLTRFIKAYRQSIIFMHEHPDEAVDAVMESVPELDRQSVKGSLQDTLKLIYNDETDQYGLGTYRRDKLQRTWQKTAEALNLDPNAVTAESAVKTGFSENLEGFK
ncbi:MULTISPECIES: ABC transporter substrate-binding protein [Bartonella]|uniref:ABC transporter substrate-binding protein n=1 Tax=Bartonella TaxID=773 RepID=UPI0018DB0EE0|nr:MULTISPECIES: ABC transporter substrate-binding protein [Bartonella]MBI0168661.1 ABC transporter substrate-binding protein [Bartonella sp. W8167]MBI0175351.1 ABC transporter substrate-binding protein [Bartonella apis]